MKLAQLYLLSKLYLYLRRYFILVLLIPLLLVANISTTHASDRLAQITSNNVLRVCIWPDYYAISFYNTKSNQLEGIDIDLAHALANNLGVEIDFVPTHFGDFVNNLENNDCDIAMFGIAVTPNRQQLIDFSQPYLRSNMYAVATKVNKRVRQWHDIDQPGVIVSVQAGTYMEGVMRRRLRNAELMVVQESNQREIEVRSGRADVFMTDYPYGLRVKHSYAWAHIIAPTTQELQFDYAYAVKQGQPAWLGFINNFVQQIKTDGRLIQYAEKHNLLPIVITEE